MGLGKPTAKRKTNGDVTIRVSSDAADMLMSMSMDNVDWTKNDISGVGGFFRELYFAFDEAGASHRKHGVPRVITRNV